MKNKNKIRKEKKIKRNIENNYSQIIKKEMKVLALIIFIFVILSIFTLVNSIILVKPHNEALIYDRNPEFEWISRYNNFKFFLSQDEEFKNLIVTKDVYGSNYIIDQRLDFGVYYWKVIALNNGREIKSSVGRFRIESIIATEINDSLKNVGNSKVDVEIIKDNKITGSAILQINEEIPVTNDTIYKIKQDE